MPRERLVTAITTGVIPAAATTGMLLGFGIRLGAPSRVFAMIGAAVLGESAAIAHARSVVTAGVLLHLVGVLLCGVAYASLVGDTRKHGVAWAIAIGAAAFAIAFIFARTIAGSIALVLTTGNLVAIGAVIAITLPIGMRLALSRL